VRGPTPPQPAAIIMVRVKTNKRAKGLRAIMCLDKGNSCQLNFYCLARK
jgi:hypothetical protein